MISSKDSKLQSQGEDQQTKEHGKEIEKQETSQVRQAAVGMQQHEAGESEFAQKEYASALSSFEEAYQIRRKSMGDAHPDTISSAFNAGKCLHSLGKPDKALRYYEICTNAVLLSPKSCQLLNNEFVTMLQIIAWAFHQSGSPQYANHFYNLALHTARKVLGRLDKTTARILNQWGNLKYECGDFHSALTCYTKGLQIESAIEEQEPLQCNQKMARPTDKIAKADEYLDTLRTLSHIASVLEKIGRLDMSLACANKMIRKCRSCYSSTSIQTSTINRILANSLSNAARVQVKLGSSDLALKSLTEAMKIQTLEYGPSHHYVAKTLNEMGIIQGNSGQDSLALQSFEESLRIRRVSNDPDASQISTVMFNIARVYSRRDESNKALTYLDDLIKYELLKRSSASDPHRSNGCSPSPVIILISLEEMARIFQEDLANPSEALRCFQQGIRIIEDDGPEAVSFELYSHYLGLAGNACLKIGDIDGAIRYFSETIRVNVANGLAYDTNVTTVPFELYQLEGVCLPCAAAA